MFEKFKKLYQIYRLLRTKAITEPPLSVLKQIPQRRIPDNIFKEASQGKILLPFKTIFYLYNWLKYETITQMNDSRYVINSFLPPMPGPGYERMFSNLTSGRKLSPVSAYIAVTSKCNYNCWHCSYKNRSGEDLSFEQISKLIDQLVDIGVSVIGLTGGEPTLRSDIVDIVKKASEKTDSMLFTNGYNFDRNLAKELKRSGLWAVAVSLDSHVPEIHNSRRSNKEAYSRAIEAIKISKENSFYTMLTTVPDVEILKDGTYKQIFKLAESLNVDEYRLVEPMPTGKILNCDDCLIDEGLREDLKTFHKMTNAKNVKPKVCSFALVESGEYFGCCAGTMHLFVDSSGNVCPCDFTPLSFGNIKEISLDECWKRLNESFKLPRYKCFMIENYQLIREYYTGKLPISYEETLKIFERVSDSDLPDYFKHVIAQGRKV